MAVRSGYTPAAPSWLPKPTIFKVAESVASQLGYEPAGDLYELVEGIGGRIEVEPTLSTDPASSGSLYVDGMDDFEIILPSHTSLVRDRFTIAHELGHYYLHYVWPHEQGKLSDRRVYALRKGTNRIEWEANWFAAGFLMPERAFRQAHREALGDLSNLIDRFDVSMTAVQIRIQDLGL